MQRRSFLKAMGAALGVGAATDAAPPDTPDPGPTELYETVQVDAEVVGDATPVVVDPILLETLRNEVPQFPTARVSEVK